MKKIFITITTIAIFICVFSLSSFVFGAAPTDEFIQITYDESNESVMVTVTSNTNLKNVCYMWNYQRSADNPVFLELNDDTTEVTFTVEKPEGPLTELVVIANNHDDAQTMIIPVTAILDDTAPKISIVSTNLKSGEFPIVLIDDAGKLKYVFYRFSGQDSYSLIASYIYGETHAEMNWEKPLTLPGMYSLSVIAFDLAGNMSLETFFIDVTAPDETP